MLRVLIPIFLTEEKAQLARTYHKDQIVRFNETYSSLKIERGEYLRVLETNEKSNRVAAYLRNNYTIKSDDLIGIHLERSEWMFISILGVLKAGGAYVSIDPEYPSSRKEYIVKDGDVMHFRFNV